MVPVAQNQRSPPEGKGKGKGQKHKITYCKGKDLFLPGKEKRHLFIIFAAISVFFEKNKANRNYFCIFAEKIKS